MAPYQVESTSLIRWCLRGNGQSDGNVSENLKLSSDEALILCSSARCVQRLLGQGWRLADRSQTEGLLHALENEDAEPGRANNILERPAFLGHDHA